MSDLRQFDPSKCKLGESVYMVIHSPFQPIGPENPDNPFIEQAYNYEQVAVVKNLAHGLRLAHKVVKNDFFGEVSIREAEIYLPEGRQNDPKYYRVRELENGYSLSVYR